MTESSKKPKKLLKVPISKYDFCKRIHENKLCWRNYYNELDAAQNNELVKSQSMRKALPRDTYEQVCEILNIPITSSDTEDAEPKEEKLQRRLLKEPMLSYRTSLHIDRDLDSDTDVEYCSINEEDKPNIYQELLKKPEREQITWPSRYLQPERDDEKSLVKKADDLTDAIANEFCEYIKQLGGDQSTKIFLPKVIKELFQIEFDTHATRGLAVAPKEIATVPERIAVATGLPEKSYFATLERAVDNDIKMEARSDNVTAFGRSLPLRDQWRGPRNNTKERWQATRHVPKDLVTFKAVWEGITHLRSVHEYCRWMIDHQELRRAPYLKSLGMFDSAVLDARRSFDGKSDLRYKLGDNAPAPIEQIRRRLSQLVDDTEEKI